MDETRCYPLGRKVFVLILALLSSTGLAAESVQPIETGLVVSGRNTSCGAATTYSRTAVVDLRVSDVALAELADVTVRLSGSHQCSLTVDRVVLSVGRTDVFEARPRLAGAGSGTFGDERGAEVTDSVIVGPGPVEVTVTVEGRAAMWTDRVEVLLAADFVTWRDRDGDGDVDDRLPGGGDCDDQDPARSSGQEDLADGIDNDCDGVVDNDTDEDGIVDALELRVGSDPGSEDSDRDGLPDALEWGEDATPVDTDEDGVPDVIDTDSDGDTVLDADELGEDGEVVDSDRDGDPDFRDTDDDDDGLETALEWEGDFDGDGLDDRIDPDSDDDGAFDGAEGIEDRDGDGRPDHRDPGGDSERVGQPTEPGDRGFGLGCQTAPAPAGAPLLLLLLLGLRRRT